MRNTTVWSPLDHNKYETSTNVRLLAYSTAENLRDSSEIQTVSR